MSYFNKFFGIYSDGKDKICYILGKKIDLNKKQKPNLTQEFRKELKLFKKELLSDIQRSINIALLHQKTFAEFQNKQFGQTIVLVGAGPSLKKFQPIENAIYIGLNRAFLKEDIKFDYLFSIDKVGLVGNNYDYLEKFIEYKGNNCIKFMGDQNCEPLYQIPNSAILKANARRYKTTASLVLHKFTLDIDSEPLGNFSTVSLQAMQFALFTNPKKIYLVGIDCTTASQGHFIGSSLNCRANETLARNDGNSILDWKNLKEFANCHYPETEIISVNPVGLKGIFKDMYTSN